MNLLIVDDEYYTVESISNKIRTLRPDFFEIFCAYNMTQALEIFSAHPIDLMICDIEMPAVPASNCWTRSVRHTTKRSVFF